MEFGYLWLDAMYVLYDDCEVVGICGCGACGQKCVEVVAYVVIFELF